MPENLPSSSDLFALTQSSAVEQHRVKGSRFLGSLFPVESQVQFEREMDKVKLRHPAATHHCGAFRLITPGRSLGEFSTDDGEPRGSAGVPILNVLRRAKLVQAGAWVVRYYGGTKLGIPGLIEAYTMPLQRALERTTLKRWEPMVSFRVTIPYDLADRVKAQIVSAAGSIQAADYSDNVRLRITVPNRNAARLTQKLAGWQIYLSRTD